MQPASPAVTQEIWHNLLGIVRTHRYAIAMCKRYRRQQFLMRVATYVGALGIVGGVIIAMYASDDPATTMTWPLLAFALETVLAITLHLWLHPERNLSKFQYARLEAARLEAKYRLLWLEVHRDSSDITPDQALMKSRELFQDHSALIHHIDIFNDKLLEQCARDADAVESERYA